MGFWGVGIFENDSACDVKVTWDRFVAPVVTLDPPAWTSADVCDFFMKYIFQRLDYGEPYDNCQVIAVGQLFLDFNLDIPSHLMEIIEMACTAESSTKLLNEWPEPHRRKGVIMSFLKRVGGKRRKPVVEESVKFEIEEENIKLGSWNNNVDKYLNELSGKTLSKDYQEHFPYFFIEKVEDVMLDGIEGGGAEKASQEYELIKNRLMVVAFWFCNLLDYSEREMKKHVNRAKKTDGIVVFNKEF